MKNIIIGLALFLLFVAPNAAATVSAGCPAGSAEITVGSGQYGKLSVTPVDTVVYYYSWYSDGITLNPGLTSTPTVDFIAPIVVGETCKDYTVRIDVTNKERGSCTDRKCITVHVCPTTCPLEDDAQCESTYSDKEYQYIGHWDNTLTLTWTVNGVERTADAGSNGKKLTVIKDWLNLPSSPTGINSKACTPVTFKVVDANGNTLTDCNKEICLVFKPTAEISSGTIP